MKKETKGKLTIKKIQVARLISLDKIYGGRDGHCNRPGTKLTNETKHTDDCP
ncbi:hypothetical protein [Aquimarina sp. BL5]|uniref:hypothetical protein n=1 Tax=Aquimarina sp. BL5 TaxID=1714860 RepID=UPI0013143E06|nr:hypothetical protein [Aquimarina sp. BL5]